MAEIETLVKAFEEAKERIFVLYETEPKDNTEAILDQAALTLSQNRYGGLIDSAIKELKEYGEVGSVLAGMFKISLRNKPDDMGLGRGRMEEYHRRFVEHAAPIFDNCPKPEGF
ncbi:MAG: hypothetical protein AAF988_07125 [Pseudomonadota bacterium]